MTSKMIYAQNMLTGVIALVPEHYLTHPNLGVNLKEVRNGKTRGRLSEIIKPDAPADNEDEPKPEGKGQKVKES